MSGRTPTRDWRSPCPDCEGAVLNVQGIGACARCDWTGG